MDESSIQDYAYDRAGRLTRVYDVTGGRLNGRGGMCITRMYGFDTASNRTSYEQYGPADEGECQAMAPDIARTWTYDSADRTTNTGYQYDNLGRTVNQPAADTTTAGGDVLGEPLPACLGLGLRRHLVRQELLVRANRIAVYYLWGYFAWRVRAYSPT